jgi:hypothetical protein
MAAWYVEANITPPAQQGRSTRGCLGKLPYATRHLAEVARIGLHRRPTGFTGRVETYHCAKCSNFHLGRDPRQTRPRSQT